MLMSRWMVELEAPILMMMMMIMMMILRGMEAPILEPTPKPEEEGAPTQGLRLVSDCSLHLCTVFVYLCTVFFAVLYLCLCMYLLFEERNAPTQGLN